MGMQKTVVSLLFCAQHRSPNPLITPRRQEKKNMETRMHTYAHTHTHTHNTTTPKKLLVVRPLCVFIVFEDKVIPSHFYVPCTRRQSIHIHTHTHRYTRHAQTHAPSTRFLTLEILLAVIYATHIHNTFETNTPLFPSCSRLARSPLREPSREPCEQLSSESL